MSNSDEAEQSLPISLADSGDVGPADGGVEGIVSGGQSADPY